MQLAKLLVGIALAAAQPACLYWHGTMGASTPAAGELDRGAQVRFAGTANMGTGYLGHRGGVAGGLAVERIAPGKNHIGFGAFGLVSVGIVPRLQGFARVSYTEAIDASTTKCRPAICGKSMGLQLGAHLVRVKSPEPDFDGDVQDAPSFVGAGLALSYRRVELGGELGHYIGLELSMLFGGALTTSHH